MKVIKIRKDGSRSVSIDFTNTISKTDQSYKKSCDINNIMANYARTGILPNSANQGYYADVSNLPSLETSFNIVNQAMEAFQALPAYVRKLIDNDPSKLADFIANSDNKEICLKHGLLVEKKEIQSEMTDTNKEINNEQSGSTSATS